MAQKSHRKQQSPIFPLCPVADLTTFSSTVSEKNQIQTKTTADQDVVSSNNMVITGRRMLSPFCQAPYHTVLTLPPAETVQFINFTALLLSLATGTVEIKSQKQEKEKQSPGSSTRDVKLGPQPSHTYF